VTGRLALGIDAGGTETRWALADARGEIVAEGQVRGFSALQIRAQERPLVAATLDALAREVLATGRPSHIHAGLTGYGGDRDAWVALIAGAFGVQAGDVAVGSDIETTYLDVFAPGEGYIVYAGTGSVAAFVDAQGVLHRAGGRGVTVDDAGGGYWIAREALRAVWRGEDEQPGRWRDSPLAAELFAMIGGPDWLATRRYVYEGTRGDIGKLALAVARAAGRDAAAMAILRNAGTELARLAMAMVGRFGPRPIALSGRAATLHPVIAESMRAGMHGATVDVRPCRGHHAAAHLALRAAVGG
jgi:N-acetylglucosamine kinase-like BadF-type ATPase